MGHKELDMTQTKRSTAGSGVKHLPAVLETQGLLQIPGSGRPPVGGNGNPLQYSCLGSPWAEELSLTGYSSWDHKRVGRDLATEQQQFLIQERVALGGWGMDPLNCSCSHNSQRLPVLIHLTLITQQSR